MIQTTFEFATCDDSFASGCLRLAHQLKDVPGLFKVTVFLDTQTDIEWDEKTQSIQTHLLESLAPEEPLISFVAQKPLNSDLAAECMACNDASIKIERKQMAGEKYIVLNHQDDKLVFINGGRIDAQQTTGQQSSRLMNRVEQLLNAENLTLAHIVRQWNYLPRITGFYSGIQNYQAFNDARSLFYNQVDWKQGYPAATGIGTVCGEVGIEVVASSSTEHVYPIINQQQIDAHSYSEEMLEGNITAILNEKSTPKFERAKLVVTNPFSTLFVSGTAAIKGEHNCYKDDPEQQTSLTLDHIDELIKTAETTGCDRINSWDIQSMRVYIKREEDYPVIQSICEQRYPETNFVYVIADVCRDELLVEIEAFVTAKL